MELNKEQFEELLKYYHLDFDSVFNILEKHIESIGTEYFNGKQMLIYIRPGFQYPPICYVGINVDVPDAEAKVLGYYNITRHVQNNLQ